MSETNPVHQQITEAYNTYGQLMQAEIENQAANLANDYVEQAIDGSTEGSPLHSEHVNSLVEEVKAPTLSDTLASEARVEERKLAHTEAMLMKKLGSGLLRASEKAKVQDELAKLHEEKDLWKGLSDSYEADSEAEKTERTEAFRDLLDAEALDVAEKSAPQDLYDVDAKPAKVKKNKQSKADKKAAKKARKNEAASDTDEESEKDVPVAPEYTETLGLDMDKKQASADRQAEHRARRQERQEEIKFNEFDRNEQAKEVAERANSMFNQALGKLVESRKDPFASTALTLEAEDTLMGELYAALKALAPEMSAEDAENFLENRIEQEVHNLREQEAANNQPVENEPTPAEPNEEEQRKPQEYDALLEDEDAALILAILHSIKASRYAKLQKKSTLYRMVKGDKLTKKEEKQASTLIRNLVDVARTVYPQGDNEDQSAYENRLSRISEKAFMAHFDDGLDTPVPKGPKAPKAPKTPRVKLSQRERLSNLATTLTGIGPTVESPYDARYGTQDMPDDDEEDV